MENKPHLPGLPAPLKVKTQYLRFDQDSGRWCIGDRDLHCGDCFQVFIAKKWYDVRIEMAGRRWYLIGLPEHFGSAVAPHQARFN